MQDSEKIEDFALRYGIQEKETLKKLYEIEELDQNLPKQPNPSEKKALQELLGVTGISGYIDYVKSGNTFELIMQWKEKTGNF